LCTSERASCAEVYLSLYTFVGASFLFYFIMLGILIVAHLYFVIGIPDILECIGRSNML